jgi:pyruvate dehydrogenase E2 component (dihydrolipoamide acetyltransferase)
MEALSPTMEEGRLVRWLKHDGDPVVAGDAIAEIETDKAVMELAARADGVLRRQLLAEGASAPVGQLIGVIAATDEDIASLVGGVAPPAAAPAAAAAAAAPAAAPVRAPVVEPAPAPTAAPVVAGGNGERVRSSPLARRLASERGVALDAVAGSGPAGRIIKRDVERRETGQRTVEPTPAASPAPVSRASASPAPATARPAGPATAAGDGYRDAPLTQMRRTIARRLSESIGPIPTFHLTVDCDVTRVSEMRQAMAALDDAYRVSVNDVMLKAVATALAQHPEVNAHWLGDRIRYFERVHIGMAVAVDDGLITPVLFDADRKGLRQLARESRDLAGRARARTLSAAEYTGSTFSVSNLGMFGIEAFTAIINPPEVGILAIGAVEARPVVQDGAVVVRQRMRLTMSCDHRVVDGATGAHFLRTLRQLIENPLLLVA